MRKIILLIFVALLFFTKANAQRYKTYVFDSVTVTADIQYGLNMGVNNDSTNLLLDIYQPYGDTPTVLRPLLILAHGGSFMSGSRKASDIVSLCKDLARRGYVCASIQYRLGINAFSGNTLEQEFSEAVWRGTQDGRAAVRWFRAEAANANSFKINADIIYAGGISAGGVLGMHLAFLDKPSEVATTAIDTSKWGGLEGNSGTPDISSKITGVVNLCGAISNVSWMLDNKNVKLCSMHGTKDQTVPYKTDYFYFFGAPIAILQGSFSVDSTSKLNGIYSDFYTFYDAPHVPFSSNAKYMDTTVNYVASSLYNQLVGNSPMGINNMQNVGSNIKLYPNPANSFLHILNPDKLKLNHISITNLSGKTVLSSIDNEILDIGFLPNGIYFLNFNTELGSFAKKFIKN